MDTHVGLAWSLPSQCTVVERARRGAEWEKLVGNSTKKLEETVLVAQDPDSSHVGR